MNITLIFEWKTSNIFNYVSVLASRSCTASVTWHLSLLFESVVCDSSPPHSPPFSSEPAVQLLSPVNSADEKNQLFFTNISLDFIDGRSVPRLSF